MGKEVEYHPLKTLHIFKCQGCGKDCDTYWEDNEDGTTYGMLRSPGIILMADYVFHTECWDKFIEENLP